MNRKKINLRIVIVTFFLILVSCPLKVLAHQPRLVEMGIINLTEPEISKAYYGNLSGKPQIYTISTSSPIDLYVNILVPLIEGPEKNVTVKIFKGEQPMGILSPKKMTGRNFLSHLDKACIGKDLSLKFVLKRDNIKSL